MVVAQLVERSLPTPEVRGSKPVIDEFVYLSTINCIVKTKIKKKEAENGVFKTYIPIETYYIYGLLTRPLIVFSSISGSSASRLARPTPAVTTASTSTGTSRSCQEVRSWTSSLHEPHVTSMSLM